MNPKQIKSSGDEASSPPVEERRVRNPIESFTRVWGIVERVSMYASLVLVIGTIGYMSVHGLI